MRKFGPWTLSVSGILITQAQTNQLYLGRQGNLSIFHKDRHKVRQLIVTGTNSKGEPELAPFSERFGQPGITCL
jgi:hypothetical protein